MTNLAKWQSVTAALISPDSFIDYSWYFTVGTFLSRRVWLGDFERALFPNLFVVCVGLAGIGKSLAVNETKKLIDSIKDTDAAPVRHPNGVTEKPNYIKSCANSTNFSSIIEEMSRSVRHSKRAVNGKQFPYIYTPFSFIEDELSALIREKEGGQIVKMLLKLYDCGDYLYQTRMHQQEKIHSPFSSLLCSTTPSFLTEAHRMGLFADGFSSRVCWLFEGRSRRSMARLEKYTPEQLKQQEELRLRLKALTKISGEVIEPQAVRDYMDHYNLTVIQKQLELSAGPMRDYYARKMTHIMKMAMCIHFSDSDNMILSLDACKEAIRMLESIEPKMRMGLSMIGRNQLAGTANHVYEFVKAHPFGCSLAEVLIQFTHDVNQKELAEILDVLMALDRISFTENKYRAKA